MLPKTIRNHQFASVSSLDFNISRAEVLNKMEKMEIYISDVASKICHVETEIANCAENIDKGVNVEYFMDKEKALRAENKALMNKEKALRAENKALHQWSEWTKRELPTSRGTHPNVPVLQDFRSFREQAGSYYVDKSTIIEAFVTSPVLNRVICRRPRRFGKSLMLSTIKYSFYGATGLFKGTSIFNRSFPIDKFVWSPANPETHDFPPCPVIHLDFSGVPGSTADDTREGLLAHLKDISIRCGVKVIQHGSPATFLDSIITALSREKENRWSKVVILIDEYDCLTRNAADEEEARKILSLITDIFKLIKSRDDNIQFCCVTGIQSNAVSGIYSGANNFMDVTYSPEAHDLCGCTEVETKRLLAVFDLEPKEESGFEYLRSAYNGYSFSLDIIDDDDGQKRKSSSLFNPFFLANYVRVRKLEDFWGQSSSQTLSSVLPHLKKFTMPFKTTISELKNPLGLEESKEELHVGRAVLEAGYGTISSVGADGSVLINPPNTQTAALLSSNYLKECYGVDSERLSASVKALRSGDMCLFLQSVNGTIASVPSHLAGSYARLRDWTNMLCHYIIVSELEYAVEDETMVGRSDIVVRINRIVYILELKLLQKSQTQELEDQALEQIIKRNYGTSSFVKRNVELNKCSLRHMAVICCPKLPRFVGGKILNPMSQESFRCDLKLA